jgi:hypothetical protein
MSNGSEVKYDSFRTYRFRSRNEAAGTNLQFLAEYHTRPGEVILVKVAVSAISAATALNPDYDSVATYARLGWVPCDPGKRVGLQEAGTLVLTMKPRPVPDPQPATLNPQPPHKSGGLRTA